MPAKVKYIKLRGTTYHLNIPIPPAIQAKYGGKVAFERTTGTSDLKEAEKQARAQKAIFDSAVREATRRADQARLRKLLDPADVATVESLGGAENLPKAVEDLRKQMAFLIAGHGATGFPDDEDLPADAMRDIQIKAEIAARQAFQDTITSEIRRMKRTAATLGEVVPPAPKFIDEGVTGIRQLAERMANDKSYTKQFRDSLRYTVRRWVCKIRSASHGGVHPWGATA